MARIELRVGDLGSPELTQEGGFAVRHLDRAALILELRRHEVPHRLGAPVYLNAILLPQAVLQRTGVLIPQQVSVVHLLDLASTKGTDEQETLLGLAVRTANSV